MEAPKNLFIISGPSGVGEDSVIEGLRAYFDVERVITTTSRPMREGDSEGNPYFFISRREFEHGIAQGEFAEYAEQYNGNLYGVTKTEIARACGTGRTVLWKIEYKGVTHAKKIYPGIMAIMLYAPLEVLASRLRRRGGISEEMIAERLEYTKEWYEHTDIYDHVVENEEGKLEETIAKVAAIIKGAQKATSAE